MHECGILYTRNDYVDEINARKIDRFPCKAMVFYNFDSVDDDEHNNYPQDILNSITPNGLPLHELRIKINCPLILLRNLDPRRGLCNGTRLVVRAVDKHILDTKIVNGTHAGVRVFIPRILLSPSVDMSLPFKFKRKQIPVHLSFVMTINKKQGQTLPPGFYVNPAKMSMPKATSLRILCILMCLELDAIYSIDILFVNCLAFFIFIKL
jgi:hypothetical protein